MGILQVLPSHELQCHSFAGHGFKCCQDYHWPTNENIVPGVKHWRIVQRSTGLGQSRQRWCKAEGPVTPGSGERGQHPSQAASSPATVTWPAATHTVSIPEKVIGLQLPVWCGGRFSAADSAILSLVVYFSINTVFRVHQVALFLFRSEYVLLSSPRQFFFSVKDLCFLL